MSKYVFITCTFPGCDKQDSLYAGDFYSEDFDVDSEFIHMLCNEHKSEGVGHD